MVLVFRFHRVRMGVGNLLVVPEEVELLLADLDRAAAELYHQTVSQKALSCFNPSQSAHPNTPARAKSFPISIHPPIPLHLQRLTCGINTLSPDFTPMGMILPSRSRMPGPTASTLASLSSLTAVSGRKMPVEVLASALTRCTRTRSRSGMRDLMDLKDWMRRAGRVVSLMHCANFVWPGTYHFGGLVGCCEGEVMGWMVMWGGQLGVVV